MPFDRKIYFDHVRESLFYGELTQGQVDGQEAILRTWETFVDDQDLRWLAYMLATTIHETASTMLPVAEYGKGQGMEYGIPDPETGETYYGRGFVQLTWRDNYAKSDREIKEIFKLDVEPSEWDADLQLEPVRAMLTMYLGMTEGWFRASSDGKRQTLERYFSGEKEDAYTAREIINGDKHIVPGWSNGVSIGNLIKGYYEEFHAALEASRRETEPPPDPTPPAQERSVKVAIEADQGVQVIVTVNGRQI